jgi:hypothetical protein
MVHVVADGRHLDSCCSVDLSFLIKMIETCRRGVESRARCFLKVGKMLSIKTRRGGLGRKVNVVKGKHEAPQTGGGQMMANIDNGRQDVGSRGIFPSRSKL